MKRLSVFFIFLITVLLVPAFSGCAPDESHKLIGTWKYDCDISALLGDAFAQEGAEEYFELDEHLATLLLTFDQDGTYAMTFDDASLKIALEEVRVELIAESDVLIKSVIEDKGLVYQIFADSVFEEIKEETEAEIDKMVDELYRELSVGETGAFLAENGRLYMQENAADVTDLAKYETYTLDNNVLTFLEGFGFEEADDSYPLVFTKE